MILLLYVHMYVLYRFGSYICMFCTDLDLTRVYEDNEDFVQPALISGNYKFINASLIIIKFWQCFVA